MSVSHHLFFFFDIFNPMDWQSSYNPIFATFCPVSECRMNEAAGCCSTTYCNLQQWQQQLVTEVAAVGVQFGIFKLRESFKSFEDDFFISLHHPVYLLDRHLRICLLWEVLWNCFKVKISIVVLKTKNWDMCDSRLD